MEDETRTPLTERKVVRRGLIAGLAGLGAAAMLKLSGAQKAEAHHDTVTTNSATALHTGVINDGTNATDVETSTSIVARTTLIASVSDAGGFSAFRVRNLGSGGAGIEAVAMGLGGDGVRGTGGPMTGSGTLDSNNGRGLVAFGGSAASGTNPGGIGLDAEGGSALNGSGGRGVRAIGGGSGTFGGTGVHGTGGPGFTGGDGVIGVGGSSSSVANRGNGVRGTTSSSTNAGVIGSNSNAGPGVLGSSASGIGVRGVGASQPGVEGVSPNSLGVRGISDNFVGVVGISAFSHGLYGSTSGPGAVGLVGENTAGGMAGFFQGNVQITGTLFVNGNKAAVIPMYDGTKAMVYCQESPEPYFEDFGRAQLVGGVANVSLEREFATLVAGGDYMVFLTPEGLTGGLYVSRRSAAGFEVRDPGNGNASFTYRIVTKRKDIEGRRFARVSDDAAKSVAAARAAIGSPAANVPGASPITPPSGLPQPNPTQQGGTPSDTGSPQPGPNQTPRSDGNRAP